MSQVIIPPKKGNGELFQIGGAIAGGIVGGPAGAMTGYSLGGALGGMENQSNKQAQGTQQSGQSDAMMRRQQQMAQDNLQVLKNAEASLPTLPEELRQQYAPAIVQARMMEEQKRGLV